MNTKYGMAEFCHAICDTNGTDLIEIIEIKLDGELIGEMQYNEFDDFSDLSTKEVESILEKFI